MDCEQMTEIPLTGQRFILKCIVGKKHGNKGCFTCQLFAKIPVTSTDVVFHSIFVIHASAYIFRNKNQMK